MGADKLADIAFELEQAGDRQNEKETARLLHGLKPAALDMLAQVAAFTDKRGPLNI